MGDQTYWNEWKKFREERIAIEWEQIQKPANPIYGPQYVWNSTQHHLRFILTLYSRGDPIDELGQYFPGLLDAWALSNRLADELCAAHGLQTCRDWTFALTNFNHYNWCFWLVGLALALEVPDAQWQRLLALIGGAGEDILLDRVIASRQPDRPLGTRLLHPKPYARLRQAIDAPPAQQAGLLRDFVAHWYPELARPGREELWWYTFGNDNLAGGSYFGRWCLEAVAAVKAFGLDDSLCLGHEHYPGDLLRPAGPSTHAPRPTPRRGRWARLFGRA
ncbi:DUF1911 domain-containing protein [Thermithiobacillus tepidarius DSM 3134]|uniref:PoNe immunity protein domain-containing protein n=1 Tax=Thermithiobacillus tepidarius TaxID=929 RepID=UPI001B7FEFD0|nr:PoNe immunity protein domain-containing protein [Thermithiobacillus tepidarius]